MVDNNFSCSVLKFGNQANIDLDGFRCFLANFSLQLYHINFGYMCIILLSAIMFISIFGGIKENYRWLIFNQAFWDLCLSYQFICNNWIPYFFYGISADSTCIYQFQAKLFSHIFDYSIDTNSYSALFLFSFCRFLGLYFPGFYKKITEKRKIAYLIVTFNFVIIVTSISPFFNALFQQRTETLKSQCLQAITGNETILCNQKFDDAELSLLKTISNILSCITFLKPIICLFLSIISAIFIVMQISMQFKFKFYHNRKDLFSSLRICIVIILQNFINLFVLIIEVGKNLPLFLGNTFNIFVITSRSTQSCKNCFQLILPAWFDGDYGLTNLPVLQGILQFRIFIECLTILFIMTGYRESLVKLLTNPKKIILPKPVPVKISASKGTLFKDMDINNKTKVV